MQKISYIVLALLFLGGNGLYAQKGHKGNKNGGGKNKGDINININIDQGKGDKDHPDDFDKKNKGDHNFDGHPDNGWHHGPHKHEKNYGGQTIIWFFGPGDIYQCKGKGKKEKIVVFDGVCVRLGTNITFMFGLLGDLRVKLDGKKGKWKPERIDKLKVEIDLLDEELKMIEIKKNKIKMRLGKLKG